MTQPKADSVRQRRHHLWPRSRVSRRQGDLGPARAFTVGPGVPTRLPSVTSARTGRCLRTIRPKKKSLRTQRQSNSGYRRTEFQRTIPRRRNRLDPTAGVETSLWVLPHPPSPSHDLDGTAGTSTGGGQNFSPPRGRTPGRRRCPCRFRARRPESPATACRAASRTAAWSACGCGCRRWYLKDNAI